MKKIFFGALLLSVISCSSTNKNSVIDNEVVESKFNLEGTVFSNANYAYLYQVVENDLETTDSVKIQDKKFKFKTLNIVPQVVYLSFDNSDKVSLFAQNNPMTISVNGYSNDSINVTGSALNDEWRKIEEGVNEQNKVLMDYYNKYVAAEQAGDEDLLDEINKEYDLADSIKNAIVLNYVNDNPKSYISPYLTIRYLMHTATADELKEYKKSFDTSISNSTYYAMIDNRIQALNNSKEGEVIADFEQKDKDGNVVKISDFRGQYVLIDFWASWCKPCRQENPNVLKAYGKYKNKDFTVLGISLDSNKEKWLEAISEDKLTWTQLSDLNGWSNEVAQKFAVNRIPFSILIDKEGKVLAKNLREDELQDFLKDLFK